MTASALRLNGTSMALVVIEDITELSELKSIVPICANCKKIRNDNNFWEQVENYLTAHTDLTFSHSICPECARKLYPDAAE